MSLPHGSATLSPQYPPRAGLILNLRGRSAAPSDFFTCAQPLKIAHSRGPLPQVSIGSMAPITACQFGSNFAYNALHHMATGREDMTHSERLATAFAAGATSAALANPTELVVIKQQQSGRAMATEVWDVLQRLGLRGMGVGAYATMAREGIYGCCWMEVRATRRRLGAVALACVYRRCANHRAAVRETAWHCPRAKRRRRTAPCPSRAGARVLACVQRRRHSCACGRCAVVVGGCAAHQTAITRAQSARTLTHGRRRRAAHAHRAAGAR